MAGKRILGPPPMGNVVKKVYDENGKYLGAICDDCCRDKTPEDVEAILRRCSEIWSRAMEREALKENAAG